MSSVFSDSVLIDVIRTFWSSMVKYSSGVFPALRTVSLPVSTSLLVRRKVMSVAVAWSTRLTTCSSPIVIRPAAWPVWTEVAVCNPHDHDTTSISPLCSASPASPVTPCSLRNMSAIATPSPPWSHGRPWSGGQIDSPAAARRTSTASELLVGRVVVALLDLAAERAVRLLFLVAHGELGEVDA